MLPTTSLLRQNEGTTQWDQTLFEILEKLYFSADFNMKKPYSILPQGTAAGTKRRNKREM